MLGWILQFDSSSVANREPMLTGRAVNWIFLPNCIFAGGIPFISFVTLAPCKIP